MFRAKIRKLSHFLHLKMVIFAAIQIRSMLYRHVIVMKVLTEPLGQPQRLAIVLKIWICYTTSEYKVVDQTATVDAQCDLRI